MKVLMLTRLFYPHVGGVEKHVLRITQELIKKGFNITIITERYKQELKQNEKVSKAKVIRIDYPKIKLIGLLVIWIELIKKYKLIKEADIVHINDVFIWYLPLRFFFPRKKVYMTFHGWEGEYPISTISIIQKKIANILTNGSICIGAYIEKYFGIKCNQISYGACDKTVVSNENKTGLVFIGRLENDTGLSIFLEAVRDLNLKKVIFIGDGELRNKCAKYGEVKGFVKNAIKYVSKTKIVYASGYLTILEALSEGCMVIAAYDNPLKENYLKDAPFSKSIFITDKSDKLASYISKILKSKEKKQYKDSKVQDWLKKQTWDKLANDYIKLWNV